MLRLHLKQIDALEEAILEIDRQVEADIAPFRAAVKQLSSTPGVKGLAAKVIVSEISRRIGLPRRTAPAAGRSCGATKCKNTLSIK